MQAFIATGISSFADLQLPSESRHRHFNYHCNSVRRKSRNFSLGLIAEVGIGNRQSSLRPKRSRSQQIGIGCLSCIRTQDFGEMGRNIADAHFLSGCQHSPSRDTSNSFSRCSNIPYRAFLQPIIFFCVLLRNSYSPLSCAIIDKD